MWQYWNTLLYAKFISEPWQIKLKSLWSRGKEVATQICRLSQPYCLSLVSDCHMILCVRKREDVLAHAVLYTPRGFSPSVLFISYVHEYSALWECRSVNPQITRKCLKEQCVHVYLQYVHTTYIHTSATPSAHALIFCTTIMSLTTKIYEKCKC